MLPNILGLQICTLMCMYYSQLALCYRDEAGYTPYWKREPPATTFLCHHHMCGQSCHTAYKEIKDEP